MAFFTMMKRAGGLKKVIGQLERRKGKRLAARGDKRFDPVTGVGPGARKETLG
jgi:hypothetical protein